VNTLWMAASFALSAALGWSLVCLCLGPPKDGWSRALLHAAMAIGLGMGCSSLIYFWVRMAVGPSTWAPLAAEIMVAAGLGVLARKSSAPPPEGAPRLRFAGVWILGPLVMLCAIAAGMLFVETAQATPHGHWDAWAIWNVRAKFLAENSAEWSRAFRPPARASGQFAGAMHPEYPPMLSAYVGRTWNYAGVQTTDAPALTGAAFSFGLAGILAAGLAVLRGATAGLLGAILLFGSGTVIDQGLAQISDVPLAFFLLAATVGAMLAARYGNGALALSGFAAGLGAWSKNEGLVLAAGLGAALVVLTRRRALWWVAGAAPGLVAAACFKLFLAAPDPLLQGSSLAAKLQDLSRYGIILRGFWDHFVLMGDGFAHPAIAWLLLAAGLGFALDTRLCSAWVAGLVAVLVGLGSYFAAYLTSPFDLQWHVGTSMERLLVQLWPTALLLAIAVLRPPGAAPPCKPERKSRKQTRAR